MRSTVTIHKGQTYLRLTDYPSEFIQNVIMPFARRRLYKFGQVPIPGTRKKKTIVTHCFGKFNLDKSEFRLSSGFLKEFLGFMQGAGYHTGRVIFKDDPVIEGKDITFAWREGWGAPRPHQEDWCEYQLEAGGVKVNNAPTGEGKSFMSIHTMVNTGKRTLITCLPRYVPIWIKSLGESLELTPHDLVIADEGDLHVAAENVQKGVIDPKIIIVPLTRYEVHFRKEKEQELPNLDDVFKDMEIGFRIMDEAHEDIYRVYMSMLYGNFEKTLALSATLKADDPFVNQIYSVIYPLECRLKEPEYTKYIDVYAYHHFIDMAKYRINTKGFGGYSHVKYEQAILKNKALFSGYVELCLNAFKEFFLEGYVEGQKSIWFFSTVEMAIKMKEEFEKVYPDYDLWVYTSKESKNKETKMSYAEHDHVFTTPQSCGTGKDIPKLFVAFSPYACSSRQRNDQMLGRTRPVDKWFPGMNPKFVYFVCRNIPKQVEYHNKRKGLFGNKSRSHKNINSFHTIS